MSFATVAQETQGPCAYIALLPTTLASASSSKLIVLDLAVEGVDRPLRALLDTGASNNFIRSKSLEGSSIDLPSSESNTSELLVRLADGSQLSVPKSSVSLQYSFKNLKGVSDFLLLDLDDRFDIILGLPWCKRHQPIIDWECDTIHLPSSSLDILISSIEESVSPDEKSLSPACDGPALNQTSPPVVTSNRFDCLEENEDDSDPSEPLFTVFSNSSILDLLSIPSAHEGRVKKTSKRKKIFTPGPGKPLSKRLQRNRSFAELSSIYLDGERIITHKVKVENPPTSAAALTAYPIMEYKEFVHAFNQGDITQVCVIVADSNPPANEMASHLSAPPSEETVATSSQMDLEVLDDKTRQEL